MPGGGPAASGDGPVEAERPPLDLRLAVPAVAVWGGAALAGRWGPSAAVLIAAAVVGGIAPLVGGALLVAERGRSGAGRRAWLAVAVAAVAGLAAGVFVAGAGGQDGRSGMLAQLAAARATVGVELVVTDDPRPIGGGLAGPAGGPGNVAVPARLVELATSQRAAGTRVAASSAAPARATAGATANTAANAAGAAIGTASGGLVARLDVPVLVLAPGDGWSGLLPSTRVAVDARLEPPRPGDQVGAVLFVRGPPRPVAGPVWYQRAAGRLRADLRAAAGVLPQPARGLFPGLVDGDVSGLDPGLRADFRAAGLTHLTAVSGGNVVILTGALLAALRRTRIGVRSRALWAAATIVGFVVIARPSASVLRAGAMGLLAAVATGTGRRASVLPALSATVAVLVLAYPRLALSAGFALSVLATAGIVIVAPGWRDRLARRLPPRLHWLADGAAVAAAAQLACTPVIAWIGGGVSLVAIPANVAAAVAVAPVTVLGVVALAVGPVSGGLARLAAWLAGWPCRWLVLVARTAADVPGATVRWPGGPLGALAALAALPAALATLRRPRGRRVCAAAAAGLLLARCVLVGRLAGWPPPGWLLVACDVGQGDALVLAAGPGAGVLIDAGPDPGALTACLDDLGIRRLPVVLLTHLHADHVDGLSSVLGHLPVGEVLVGPLHEPADRWAALRAEAEAAGVPLVEVGAGASRAVGPVTVQVIGPVRPLRGTDSDPNNNSLVAVARAGGLTILLAGDAEHAEQRQLLTAGAVAAAAPRIDVLKVAHHGSASQEAGLLGASGARTALISVGAGNQYGHPAPVTLAALTAAGIPYARTDTDGATAVVAAPAGVPALVARRQHRDA
ncbi:ComEC/Rec2 family competence protein [Pseudofrankia sp. BMG5.36]|uniref:ComEC/Rec2 family competence protein n=1 Tax=Pseudofrankia sp. BMG5.36 TaxID=1834512 RepID=UPI001041E6EE|nr:ComEC/Rec2 family competence protein [Pseudofrankia sp. BMG5.36]